MININLRDKLIQNNISKVENAFEPLYKIIAHKINRDYGVIKGEWEFNYQITTDCRAYQPNTVCFIFRAFNEKLRAEERLFVYCDLGNTATEIKIVDATKAKHSSITGFDERDAEAVIDNQAYENDTTDAGNRKHSLLVYLKEMTDPDMFAINDYVTEVFTRFDYRLNNEWKKIDTSKRLEVELTATHSYESKWFALPIDESNPENHYWLTIGYVVDYRGNIMIRPDDDLHELNQLAKFMQKHDIHNTATMYAYVQENKPELLNNQIYRYTDDNLNKALDEMTPAQIVKNTHTDSWNLSDPFATNEADYFMVKDGTIKLLDKIGADSQMNENMNKVFSALCQLAKVNLGSDRHKKPYWL